MGTLGKVAPTMIILFTLCMSSATQAIRNYKPPSCINTPPYDMVHIKGERFVRNAPGVKLEVLDWGGLGEVMVLLTGSGDNAHVRSFCISVHQFLPRDCDYPARMAAIAPAKNRLRCPDEGS
jgi:hypothetical protein